MEIPRRRVRLRNGAELADAWRGPFYHFPAGECAGWWLKVSVEDEEDIAWYEEATYEDVQALLTMLLQNM